jgi:hypothetical protein
MKNINNFNNFCNVYSNPIIQIEMEEKMKKTNQMLGLLNVETNVNFNVDVKANVKIGRGGGAT